MDILDEHGLEQLQRKPSRKDNILDLYITNNSSLVKACDTVPGISDHNMIIIDSDIEPSYSKPKRRTIHLFKKANVEKVKQKIRTLSNKIIEMNNTVEIKWSELKQGIEDIMKKDIPSKMTSKRHNLPWITHKTRRQINRKHKFFQRAKKTNKEEDWEKFREIKRKTQNETRQSHNRKINRRKEQ